MTDEPYVPDVELLLQSTYANALAEASERAERGAATSADLDLLKSVGKPVEDPHWSQAEALDRWERGSR